MFVNLETGNASWQNRCKHIFSTNGIVITQSILSQSQNVLQGDKKTSQIGHTGKTNINFSHTCLFIFTSLQLFASFVCPLGLRSFGKNTLEIETEGIERGRDQGTERERERNRGKGDNCTYPKCLI